jgi:hypothetical protein
LQRNTRTTTSISWTIQNDTLEDVELYAVISTDPSASLVSQGALLGNQQTTISATSLNPNTTYYIRAQIRKTGFTDSNIVTDN